MTRRTARLVLSIVVAVSLVMTSLLTWDGMGSGRSTDGFPFNSPSTSAKPTTVPTAKDIPMDAMQGFFTANMGQVDNRDVRYFSDGNPLSVGFTSRGAILTLKGPAYPESGEPGGADESIICLRLAFLGCGDVEPEARFPLAHASNYFLGRDPDGWVRNAPNYAEVWYVGVYPGTDMRFYFKDGALKYDFIVRDGGDPSDIRLAYEGADGLSVDATSGDLLVSTSLGTVRDEAPCVSYLLAGARVEEGAAYELLGGSDFGFDLPTGAASSRPLTIDPGLRACTLIGTAKADESAWSIALDAQGNVIVGVLVRSSDFPTTPGAYNTTWGSLKGCVVKLDPTLSRPIFSTFYGGVHSDTWGETLDYSIDVLRNESILVVGYTITDDFPITEDAYDKDWNGGMDEYIMVLGPNGDRLEYASFFGGSMDDFAGSTYIDDFGALYLAGCTYSSDLPVSPGAYQKTKSGGSDVYIVKFDISLRHLQFCTYLGGSSDDTLGQGSLMGCDIYKNVYITGTTTSSNFPTTPNAYHPTPQGNFPDIFLAKLNADATRLLYGTFIGGDSPDTPVWLHVTQIGMSYIIGTTKSADFPVTIDANDSKMDGSDDGFLMVFDAQCGLWYSSLIGGDLSDLICGAALDETRNRILITGTTSSTDLPCTPGCYNPFKGGAERDLFIAALSLISYEPEFFTYVGSTDISCWVGMPNRHLCVDADGGIFMPGSMKSTQFPTTSGVWSRNAHGKNYDAFLLSYDPTPVAPPEAPKGLKASAGDGQVNVTWDAPTNESYVTLGHELHRGLTPDQLDCIANLTTGTSYLDTNVTNGKRYFYELRARNSMGVGDAAGPIMVRPMGRLTEPLGLAASTGDGTVVLTWSPPASTGGAEILGYHIIRGSSEATLALLETIPVQCDYTDVTVVPGVGYLYAVKAFNENGNGTMCLPIVVEVLARPSAPEGLSISSGFGWVELVWAMPADTGGAPILGFNVYGGTSPGTMSYLASKTRYDTMYNDTSVEGGVTYYYAIAAMTKAGEGQRSDTLQATPTGLPGPPDGFALTPGDRQVLLTWFAPKTDRGSPVTAYAVLMGPDEGTLVEVARIGGDSRQYARRALENGLTYYFSLRAVNLNGEGPTAAPRQAMPLGIPSAPLDLTALVVSDGVALTWLAPTDNGGSPDLSYRVLRGATRSSMAPMAISRLGALTYLDSSVELGDTYHFSVLAVNSYGEEGPRAPPVEVLYAFAPSPITGLRAVAGEGRVNLTWSPPEGTGGVTVLGYIVLRGTSESELIEIGSATGTTYEDVYVTNGITVWYAVRATNAAGVGAMGETVPATPMARPTSPEGLTIEYKDGAARLRWRTPTGPGAAVSGYVLSRGSSLEELGRYAELGVVNEFVDKDVEHGRVYFYTLIARSPVGDSAMAGPVKLEVPGDIGPLRLAALLLGALLTALVLAIFFRSRRGSTMGGDEGQSEETRPGAAAPPEAVPPPGTGELAAQGTEPGSSSPGGNGDGQSSPEGGGDREGGTGG